MTLEQFWLKRIINELTGVAHKFKRNVWDAPVLLTFAITVSLYNGYISKKEFLKLAEHIYENIS